ncbi:MAG: VCBS repeat-containing protein [Fuerstiella sp.]
MNVSRTIVGCMSRRLAVMPGLLLLSAAAVGCGDTEQIGSEQTSSQQASTSTSSTSAGIAAQVKTFCGDCHVAPRPESFPRDAWHDEVRRGFDFYFSSGRTDLVPPIQAEVTRYFRDLAPDTFDCQPVAGEPSPIHFRRFEPAGAVQPYNGPPAVSFVSEVFGGPQPAWWVSDMRQGTVSMLTAEGRALWSSSTASAHPAAVRVCDLDRNGQEDLLCTDLGSFLPEDHDRGRLVWISNRGTDEQQETVLLDGIGRVADVAIADLDGDDDDDLVVAEFGWHKTGGIHLLRNISSQPDGVPAFETEELDDHSGPIHVLVTDLNGDDRLDILALISQEHEQVVAFVNGADGFTRRVLYPAPDPSWGSSGISLVDLDQDGDQDILYTNGDTFDSYLIKPYHGITWLENQNDLTFVPHHLASLPGVHRALAADFDQDGDMDIAAVALLPEQMLRDVDATAFHSAIWLEQTQSGDFVTHVIDTGRAVHAAMTLSDYDGDGDIDIVAGNFVETGTAGPLVVYVNDGTGHPRSGTRQGFRLLD